MVLSVQSETELPSHQNPSRGREGIDLIMPSLCRFRFDRNMDETDQEWLVVLILRIRPSQMQYPERERKNGVKHTEILGSWDYKYRLFDLGTIRIWDVESSDSDSRGW